MTVRVNLLPHREERRKAQRKHLGILAGMVAALAAAIIILIHGIIAGYISVQGERNAFVKKENASLDKEIDEIKKLKEDIASLLARKQVIERLQSDRVLAVSLLEQLVQQVPDGVYLTSIKQKGRNIAMVGYSQSNARVSQLMRNIGSSPSLEKPVLVEIKAATVNSKRVSEFSMNLSLKGPASEAATDGAGKAGAGKAGAAKDGAGKAGAPKAEAAKAG